MLHPLRGTERGRIRGLLSALPYPRAPLAFLADAAAGTIYVDDPVAPRATFVRDATHNWYLAGDPGREAFNQALARLIETEIYPRSASSHQWGFQLQYGPASWNAVVHDLILRGKAPIQDTRQLYTLDRPPADWSTVKASELGMERVDAAFLERSDLRHLDALQDWIAECWPSQQAYCERGFGYCLVADDSIMSWCMAEYLSDGACGIGVETVEGQRGKGYATWTSMSLVEHCLRHNVTPYWDCWASNIASAGLARKVGFRPASDYQVAFGWFNALDNMLVNGNMALRRGDYTLAVTDFERAFGLGEDDAQASEGSLLYAEGGAHSDWCYYNAARAWALAGEPAAAWRNLLKAVQRGYADRAQLRSEDAFSALRQDDRWSRLLARLDVEATTCEPPPGIE